VNDKQGIFFASCKRLATHAQTTIRQRRGRHLKEQNMMMDEDDEVQEGGMLYSFHSEYSHDSTPFH
jgi:hypothetical protein